MPESNKAGLDSLGEKNQTQNGEEFICDMLFDDWHSKDLEPRLGSKQTYRIYIKEICPILGKCAVCSGTLSLANLSEDSFEVHEKTNVRK